MVGPKLFVPHLPLATAMVFANGLLLGLYLVTYCFANRWLLFTDEGWRFRKRFHWLMVVITNVLVVLLLADATITLRVYMSQMDAVQDGHGVGELTDSPWHPIAAVTISNTIGLLTDIALMHRLWFVYGKGMIIIWFPIFLWVGGFVCTILQILLQVKHIHDPGFGPYRWAAVDMSVAPGIVLIPFWLSTIVLNAYCTGLIIWRIRKASKMGATESATRQFRFLVRVLMESGILYLVVGLAHFFAWCAKDSFAIVLFGMINRIVVAIAYNLVLIRIGQNKAEGEESRDSAVVLTTIEFNGKTTSVDDRGRAC